MIDHDARLAFASLLDRLAHGQATREEWQALVVGHYGDEGLEDVRRRCVRLAINSTTWDDWSATERDGFRSLAAEVRCPESH
jgi:hypothetical protein